jgi:hypothetical protein
MSSTLALVSETEGPVATRDTEHFPDSAGYRLGELEQRMARLEVLREVDQKEVAEIKAITKEVKAGVDALVILHEKRKTIRDAFQVFGSEIWRILAYAAGGIGVWYATNKSGH